MAISVQPVRVLYSFPHKLGGGRINTTAWHQVAGLAAAGADVTVFPAAVHTPVPASMRVYPTLAYGKVGLPPRVLGHMRTFALHDWIVSRRLQKMAGQIDIVHTWPQGALRTLQTAARLGIPSMLERPNAHTRVAYELVRKECESLGVKLPGDHEHAFNPRVLRREEQEFNLAFRLLCPSDFVVRTFLDQGFSEHKLVRHIYGYDEGRYFPSARSGTEHSLTVLFAGVCAVRKGLHYALDAWLRSPASQEGTFLIAGQFIPEYRSILAPMLSHPSIRILGFRKDMPELMRKSDVLILPTVEEGSALVTAEARGSGCVLLVSDAAGAVCKHGVNALVHRVGDVATLTKHITMLYEDRLLLRRLRASSLQTLGEITWNAAGRKLLDVYSDALDACARATPLAVEKRNSAVRSSSCPIASP